MPLDHSVLLRLHELSLYYYAQIYPDFMAGSLIICAVVTFLISNFFGLWLYFIIHAKSIAVSTAFLFIIVLLHAIPALQLWLEVALANDRIAQFMIGITAIYFSIRSFKLMYLLYTAINFIYAKFSRHPSILEILKKKYSE